VIPGIAAQVIKMSEPKQTILRYANTGMVNCFFATGFVAHDLFYHEHLAKIVAGWLYEMNFTEGLEELQSVVIRKSSTEQKIMNDWGIDEMP
jgi:hypothetical protein